MYFDVTIIFLMVLATSKYMDSAPASVDYDLEWDKLFGHLSEEFSVPRVTNTKPEKFVFGKHGQAKPSARPAVTPAPPAPPFIFNPDSKEKVPSIPSIGANSQGSMEGIAISQNRGVSLGIYMVNSTYNNFNTVFGHSNVTQTHTGKPTLRKDNVNNEA